MKILLKGLLLCLSITLLFSCQKGEGEGGRATIKGKAYVKEMNDSFTAVEEEYYASAEDVYIIYGDNDIYDDDMETNYDGTFKFEYLQKGTYTIFVYSRDDDEPSGEKPVFETVEITKKTQVVDLGTITIFK